MLSTKEPRIRSASHEAVAVSTPGLPGGIYFFGVVCEKLV